MKDYHRPVSLDRQCSHYPISRHDCANRIRWVSDFRHCMLSAAILFPSKQHPLINHKRRGERTNAFSSKLRMCKIID